MTARYVPGQGTTLSITPNGGSLTAIGHITSIKPASPEREEIDVSNLGSTWMEYLLAVPDGGELEFTIEWDSTDAGHAALWTNFTDASPTDAVKALWTVAFNDLKLTTATTVTFNGAVKSFPWDEIDLKKIVTVPIVVKVTGAITITPAT
jgi:hypothetical protein